MNRISTASIGIVLGALTLVGCGGSGGGADKVVAFPPAIYVARVDPGNVVSMADMAGTDWKELSTPGYPGALTFDKQGRMITALYFDAKLVRYSNGETVSEQTFGSIGSGVNQFDAPTDIAVDNAGRIYVADSENRRLVRMDNFSGAGWTTLDLAWLLPDEASITSPTFSIAVDDSDRIYVLAPADGKILRFNDMSDPTPVTYGSTGNGVGQFEFPSNITVRPDGSIYIADPWNSRIVRIDDMTGAGWTTYGTSGNGVGNFTLPTDISFDNLGRIYVLDRNNKRIVRIDDMSGTGWVSYGTDNTPGGGSGPWCQAIVVKN